MQSVLEISTDVCRNVGRGGRPARGPAPPRARDRRGARGLTIGSAATHPFAKWEDQRIVERERYREIVDALGFVARQELLFGLHVHVGIDDADKAIHVANGMRVHLPILLALSTNSPFWRGRPTGLMSSRTPIFRLLPRVGIPPRFEGWDEYCERIEFMVEAGVVPDYTFLWWDVRPHPNLGTVEVRSCDAQTRLEHTRRAHGPDPGDGEGALRALRGAATELAHLSRPSCSRRTSGSRPATASQGELIDLPTARASRRRSWRAGWSSACARMRASWAPSASSRRSRT